MPDLKYLAAWPGGADSAVMAFTLEFRHEVAAGQKRVHGVENDGIGRPGIQHR
jgi:hypothetical protein